MSYKRLTDKKVKGTTERYIRVDKDYILSAYDIIDEEKQEFVEMIINRLAELEDKIENGTLEEVIRCKDCKYLEELHYEEVGEKPYIKTVCRLFKRTMQLNDFCSYGKLKELQKDD